MRNALDIRSSLKLSRHFWRAENIGWAMVLLVLAGALYGMFGAGTPLPL